MSWLFDPDDPPEGKSRAFWGILENSKREKSSSVIPGWGMWKRMLSLNMRQQGAHLEPRGRWATSPCPKCDRRDRHIHLR